jgi:hypothetical protein
MRACSRCGHVNADQLVYCFSCGRRLGGAAGITGSPDDLLVAQARGPASGAGPDGFAATVPLSNLEGEIARGAAAITRRGPVVPLFSWGLDSLRYVFAYVRGRIDAEDQKRRLIEEREGAKRLIEGAFAELGQLVRSDVRADVPDTSQVADLIETIARAETRREAAITDLAAVERFQEADDARLAKEQAAAETDWKACDLGATEVDKTLRRIDDERREIDLDIARLDDDSKTAEPLHRNTARAALVARRATLNVSYAALRERAAALRASTVATRTKLDQAVSARRQASVAMAASLAGHARARNDADSQIRDLVTQLGRAAAEARLALPSLTPTTGRIARLEQLIADRNRQLVGLERNEGHSEIRKLAIGVALLCAILGALVAGLWAFFR